MSISPRISHKINIRLKPQICLLQLSKAFNQDWQNNFLLNCSTQSVTFVNLQSPQHIVYKIWINLLFPIFQYLKCLLNPCIYVYIFPYTHRQELSQKYQNQFEQINFLFIMSEIHWILLPSSFKVSVKSIKVSGKSFKVSGK